MGQKDSTECKENCVIINDIDDVTIRQMLEFMYCEVTESFIDDQKSYDYSALLKAAEKYDIQDLKKILIEKIEENLDKMNVLDSLILSHLYLIPTLKDKCFEIMKNNKDLLSHNNSEILSESPDGVFIIYNTLISLENLRLNVIII